MFNRDTFQRFLTDVVNHYDKSAPTVAAYADDLYIRVDEQPEDVRLVEIEQISRLLEDGEWMHPNYAANYIYKLMHQLGMNTVGHAGF